MSFLPSHPFHLSGSEVISGMEDKRPNIVTKETQYFLTLLFRKVQEFGEFGTKYM